MALKQYQGMTEEEVFEAYADSKNQDYDRIKRLKEKMALDYDLDDLNANDQASLDDLCTLFIRVEDMDNLIAAEMRKEEPDHYNIQNMSKTVSQWRDSISKMSQDLYITRKARRGDNETSVVASFQNIKERAKTLFEERLSYIYCPKCKMLLANSWFLYPENGNSITLTCGRPGCNHKFTVTSRELLEKGNRNLEELLPL
jgi:RNase P subunit RPR2